VEETQVPLLTFSAVVYVWKIFSQRTSADELADTEQYCHDKLVEWLGARLAASGMNTRA